ncbi:MAG: SIMPL domain-containing protein [Bdellovibrionales bacterium]|nr:SIMPL domain-containing protein [Bdellovibrionales bacterium]
MKSIITIIGVCLFSFSSFAAETLPRQVSVSGECNHVVSPDRGSITLVVEYQNMDLTKATKEAAMSYERVTAQIKKLNLKNLNMRTSEYSVHEIKAWENNRSVNKGFQARMGIWISTSEIGRIGEVIAIASKEKVKNVYSLQTYLSDEKQLAEEIACLEDASQNARHKAQKMASALGAKLGKVMIMNESGRSLPSWPQPVMQRAYGAKAMAMESADMAPSVESGTQNLSLSIQVTFALE